MQNNKNSDISILVVEDDGIARQVISILLKKHFGNVFIGQNGQQGLELFLEHRPNIVVTDIAMPVMDGLTMSREIKKIDKNIPIIVLTSFDNSDILIEAIESGIEHYLMKPFNKDKLLEVLDATIESVLIKKKLEAAENELRALNQNLEQLVAERTVELSATNEQLRQQIQEKIRAQQELVEANSRVIAASKTKDIFLANMSHELRTPLHGIFGLTSLLSNSRLDAKQSEYVRYIQSAAKSLLSIINDILDISSIEAGKIHINNEPFNVRNVINAVAYTSGVLAEEKGLKVSAIIDENIPELIIGDEGRLRQVLTNLMGNAVKFTNQGFINLRCELQPTVNNQHTLLFCVEDSGMGIAQTDTPKLFQNFSQINPSFTRVHGGTGLGLAISKQIIELMNGRIWVESKPNSGSKFFFTMQFTRYKTAGDDTLSAAAASTPNPLPVFDKTGCHILVCDDNAINLRVVCDFLSEIGYNIETAESGTEVLQKAGGKKFDLILLDIQFPDIDGYELAGLLRASDSLNKDSIIIALTAHAKNEIKDKCIDAGMDDFFSKPVDLELLEARLAAIIVNKPQRQTAKSSAKKNPADLDIIYKVTKGSPSKIASYINQLLTTYPADLLSLKEAVKSANTEQALLISHTLKATFGNFLAMDVVSTLNNIFDMVPQNNWDKVSGLFDILTGQINEVHNYLDSIKQELQ